MTQAVSGVRRAWVGFSALSFAICGVLLVVQFGGGSAPPAAAPSPGGPTFSAPAPTADPAKVAPPPPPKVRTPEVAEKSTSDDKPVARDAPELNIGSTGKGYGTGGHGAALANGSRERLSSPQNAAGKKGAPPRTLLVAKADSPPTGRGGSTTPVLKDPSLPPRAPETARSPARRNPPETEVAAGEGEVTKKDTGKLDDAQLGAPTLEPAQPDAPKVGAAKPALPAATSPSDASTQGVLKVNVPASMMVGQSEHVRAVVGAKMHVDLVDKEAALETNDGARVQLGRDLLITSLVQMELRSDIPGDFDITSFTPDAVQRISDNDATVWEWAVMPKQEGKRGLTLVVTDLKEGSKERVRTKIYPVHIEVHVATMQKVRELAVAGSSALSGLAGLIGAWLGLLRPALQRRRPEGEADGRPPRTTPAAAPPPPAPTPPVAVAPVVVAAIAPVPAAGHHATAPPATTSAPAIALADPNSAASAAGTAASAAPGFAVASGFAATSGLTVTPGLAAAPAPTSTPSAGPSPEAAPAAKPSPS